MKNKNELTYKDLKMTCDDSIFTFDTTAELEAIHTGIGQERGIKALEFGLQVDVKGYNLYLEGPSGVGKTMYTKNYLDKISIKQKVPSDWCYIYNFDNPNMPISVSLPAGQGKEFRDNMDGFIKEIKKDIKKTFNADDFEKEKALIKKEFEEKREVVMTKLNEDSLKHGFQVKSAQNGDNIVSAKNIYGGSFNLFEHTLPQYGIQTTFVNIFNEEEQKLLNYSYSKFNKYLDSNDFVLIHNDLHFDNIFYNDGKIKLIDFERSMYAPRDFELDILYRMIRKPWKFASEETERYTDSSDYTNIMLYIEKYYPELVSNPNLHQRLAIYDMVYFLEQLVKHPELEELKNDVIFGAKVVALKDEITFNDVKTPMELMDFMNVNIEYGWIDNQGFKHLNNLKGFRKNYTIKETRSNKDKIKVY